jgi:hypothetical protein
MTEEMPGDTKNRKETEDSDPILYRAKNLSFCPLSESVIVLDPNQGLYFRMTSELASLLRSLPEVETEDGSKVGPSYVRLSVDTHSKFESLSRYGLIEIRGAQLLECANHRSTGEISVWGSVTELTQMTPPPPPSSGPPGVV